MHIWSAKGNMIKCDITGNEWNEFKKNHFGETRLVLAVTSLFEFIIWWSGMFWFGIWGMWWCVGVVVDNRLFLVWDNGLTIYVGPICLSCWYWSNWKSCREGNRGGGRYWLELLILFNLLFSNIEELGEEESLLGDDVAVVVVVAVLFVTDVWLLLLIMDEIKGNCGVELALGWACAMLR